MLVDGVPARTYDHDGETYVLGQLGARYTLRVSNHSGRRIEAVVSVDGRDVIDGRPADFRDKRGYLVPAWGSVDIDGWRISHVEAAAFRFSSRPRLVRGAHRQRARGRRHRRRRLPRALRRRRRVYYAAPRPTTPALSVAATRDDELRRGDADERARAATRQAPPPPHAAPARRRARAPPEPPTAGRGAARTPAAEARPRPGLGTEYGEAVSSPIYEVEFVRANAGRPAAFLGARYNDRDGLLAMGIPVDGSDETCCDDDDGDLRRTRRPVPGRGPPLRRAPVRMAARLRLAVEPGEDAVSVDGERRSDEALLAAYRAGDVRAFETPPRPSREAGLEFPPPLRARRRRGGGSVAGGVLARGEERGRVAGRRRRSSRPGSTPSRATSASTRRGARSTGSAGLAGRWPVRRRSAKRRRCTIGSPRPARRPTRWSRRSASGAPDRRAVAALPDDQREVFLMREVMEMPFAEIAAAVGASEPTVKSRMRYALEKLRAALAELGDEPAGRGRIVGVRIGMAQMAINCEDVTRADDGAPLRGAAGRTSARTLEAHVAGCARCRAELAGFQETRAARAPGARRRRAAGARASARSCARPRRPSRQSRRSRSTARAAAPQPSFWERWRARWTLPTFATVGAVAVFVLASKVFLEPDKTVELGRQALQSAPAEAPLPHRWWSNRKQRRKRPRRRNRRNRPRPRRSARTRRRQSRSPLSRTMGRPGRSPRRRRAASAGGTRRFRGARRSDERGRFRRLRKSLRR